MHSPRSRRMARRSRSSETTCRSARQPRGSSGPISSATAARPARSKKCCRTCSSSIHREITTGYSTSAVPSPETSSSCRLLPSWTTSSPRPSHRTTTEEGPALERSRSEKLGGGGPTHGRVVLHGLEPLEEVRMSDNPSDSEGAEAAYFGHGGQSDHPRSEFGHARRWMVESELAE